MSKELVACLKCNSFYVSQHHMVSFDTFNDRLMHSLYTCLDCGFDWTQKSEEHIEALLSHIEKTELELDKLRRVITTIEAISKNYDEVTYRKTFSNIAQEIKDGTL